MNPCMNGGSRTNPSLEVRKIVAHHAAKAIEQLSGQFHVSLSHGKLFITRLQELLVHGRVQSTRKYEDAANAVVLTLGEKATKNPLGYLRVHLSDMNADHPFKPPHYVMNLRVAGPPAHKEALLRAAGKFHALFMDSREELMRLTGRSKLEIEAPVFEEPKKM